ncbi:MAG: hypothetical protein FWD62_11595 [Betaproteobacteria bacterium]|nr:hypothetical protein [Betaproteobacteria bacterium]
MRKQISPQTPTPKPSSDDANTLAPCMRYFEENLAALEAHLRAPLLGVVPYYQGGPAEAATVIRLPQRL